MSSSLPVVAPGRRLTPRLVGAFIAVLALVLGPLTFAPAHAADAVRVSGSVLGEGAGPLEDVSVELQEFNEQDQYFVTNDWAYTDEDGAFAFEEIAAGTTYRVRVEGTGGFVTATGPSFKPTEDVTLAPLALVRGASVSGTVAEAGTNALIEGATVVAFPFDGKDIVWDDQVYGQVDEAGAFRIDGLPAGQVKIQIRDDMGNHVAEYYDNARTVDAAKPVTVTKGATTPLGAITLEVGASFAGTLKDMDGNLVSDARVYALLMVDGQADFTNAYDGFVDDEGHYTIGSLPAGTYKVHYLADGFFEQFATDKATEETATLLTVTTGQAVDLGATVLERTAGVTGTVRKPDGSAFPEILVEALPVVDGKMATDTDDYAYTDDEGSFRFDGPNALHAGTYRLRFIDGMHAHKDLLGAEFTVAGGEMREVPPVTMLKIVKAPPVKKKSAAVSVKAVGGKKKATFTITVKASGVTPTGKVSVKLGSKTLKSVTLKKGKATVKVTKQKKGKRTYRIVYAGDAKVLGKTVTTKKVTIK